MREPLGQLLVDLGGRIRSPTSFVGGSKWRGCHNAASEVAIGMKKLRPSVITEHQTALPGICNDPAVKHRTGTKEGVQAELRIQILH